jgi:DNA-binding SARP family transcriptional activator
VLLSALRDVLQPRPAGDDPLISTGGAVSLNRALVSIDVDEFLTRATAALSAERSREPDVTARDSPPPLPPIPEISSKMTHITSGLLRWPKRSGLPTSPYCGHWLLEHALRLLEQDCYDEEAHLNLVGVLLHAGRLAEARRHYESYVRRMTEIGIIPRPLSAMTSRRQPS